MKYSNGGWMIRDGFNVDYAVHIYDVKKEADKLTLYTPFHYTGHKGHTLDGGMLTIEITAPQKEIFGIKMYHFKGILDKGPNIELNTNNQALDIQETEDLYIIENGKLSVEITKGGSLNDYFQTRRENLN